MPDDLSTSTAAPSPDRLDLQSQTSDSDAAVHWSGMTLVVNDQRIPLAESTDVPALMDELVAAVTEKARFVHLDGLWGQTYEVLVTAASQVLLGRAPLTVGVGALDGQWTDRIDLDIW